MAGYAGNSGYGDDASQGNSLTKDQIENLANRTDISDEEKQKRRHKLEEGVAAGVVGAGIVGYAGYHHHEKKEGEKVGSDVQQGEKKHHHFGL